MTTTLNSQWRLRSRPVGNLRDSDLEWREEPVPELADGQFLVRLLYLSIDPTNRIWMSDMPQYMPPVEIGDVMRGAGVGVVEASRHPGLAVGDKVSGLLGWQRYAVSDGSTVSVLPEGLPVPPDAFVAVLNHIGATAYFGLLDIGKPVEGETVVVSTAAGAVGSLVGQIAKIKGCRAIGLTSTDEKCAWVTELGYDGVINYKTEDVAARLEALCPDGIDVYFDNVGGSILNTALSLVNQGARIPTCGLISMYNEIEPVPGPVNYTNILMKRVRVEGFIVTDYADRFQEAFMAIGGWMAQGRIKYRLDLIDGLDQAPAALRRIFAGGNIGKLAVKVSEP